MPINTHGLHSPSLHAPPARILIGDDDSCMRALLEELLADEGYEVISAADGHSLVRLAQECAPDIILVDLVMPGMDGYEAIRQLRNDTRTAHIPMLILTGSTRSDDVVIGFDSGADDYIVKPFDIFSLLARIRSHLRRATQRPVRNPLTGLPGGMLFAQEMRHRIEQRLPLALLYIDIDNFKIFNDTYGFARGDQVILLLAHILVEVVTTHGTSKDVVGHIGGDDFVVLTLPDRVDTLCQAAIALFDREVRGLYHPSDRERGYLSGADRYGVLRRFGLMTISIGGVTNRQRSFTDEEKMSRVAAEMKQYAKGRGGSSYAIDKRVTHCPPPVERRGTRRVVLFSSDTSLCGVLRTALKEAGYTSQEVADLTALRTLIAKNDLSLLVLADARLGQPLWDLCAQHSDEMQEIPIVVLTCDDLEVQQATAAGATACLQQPLPLRDIITCITELFEGDRREHGI